VYPSRRATASANVRSAGLLRWLLRALWNTWLGPDAPTPSRDELRRGGEGLRSGHWEFRDGPRFLRHFHGALRPEDLRGKQILDVGCGFGGRTVYYAETCGASSAHGIETTLPKVELCRKLATELGADTTTFSVGYIEEIPFPDSSFDGILSSDVLEHCQDPRKAVEEITRVLRPGGRTWNVFPTYKGARSSHLGYLTQLPIHRVFHPDTVIEVVNEFIAEEGERLRVGSQPAPSWSTLGHYTLPRLNGMTLKEARQIFKSTPGLKCERMIITPLIDPQLSRPQMEAALGSSKTRGMLAFAVAHSLGAWQRMLPLPEFLVQNIAACAVKT
jgi:SAM-dependent methyltransferase